MILPFFASRSVAGAPAPPALLLDAYPTAAAAFSVRRVRAAYAGQCLRVRRGSDDTELDIGFSSNALNVSAAETFCAGTTGFVRKWYDQSGNANDLVMATNATQPQIVASGSILQEGGLPAVTFTATKRLDLTATVTGNASWSMGVVFKRTSLEHSFLTCKSDNWPGVRSGTSGYYTYIANNTNYSRYDNPVTSGTKYVGLFILTASLEKFWRNGSQLTPDISHGTISVAGVFEALGYNTGAGSHTGTMQEVVLWSSDRTSDVAGINTNINAYFGVY